MATQVRSADVNNDKREIVEFLERNHAVDSNPARFDWLYRNAPAGPARVWISSDSKSREMIGMAAAFPRQICLQGKVQEGWVLGDFCIASAHRSLGPALQLQRACLAGIESDGKSLFYDFPSTAMVAVYRRLGMDPGETITRLAHPLRLNRQVDALVKYKPVANIVSSLVNKGLALHDRKIRQSGGTITIVEGGCDEEFTQLADSVASKVGVCLQRSKEYLNWRYLQHPYRRYEILTMRNAGLLTSYAVVSEEGRHLNLADVFGKQEYIAGLIAAVISIARERKLDSVTTGIVTSHPWIGILEKVGFRRRESFPVITQSPRSVRVPAGHAGWFLTNGDRES
jgi:hypothetical protein